MQVTVLTKMVPFQYGYANAQFTAAFWLPFTLMKCLLTQTHIL